MPTIVERWTARLRRRRAQEAKAKTEHTAARRALKRARTKEDRAQRRLRLRRQQVAYAERVLRRNRGGSARQRAVRFALAHAGKVVEQPAGSNQGGLITIWQRQLGDWLVGQAWCGVFIAACLNAARVPGITYRLASVAFIEDDARAGRGPFRAWSTNPGAARPGDAAVLFGRGVHVELVVRVDQRAGTMSTVGGNTSSGASGSQSNGGGCYRRVRPFSAVHGVAHVRYPDQR